MREYDYMYILYGSVSEKMKSGDRFREKGPSAYYKMCYKSALC